MSTLLANKMDQIEMLNISFSLTLNLYNYPFYNSLEYFMFIKLSNLCFTLLNAYEYL